MSKIVGIDIGGTKMLMFSNYMGNIVEEKVATGISATPAYLVQTIHAFVDKLDYIPDAIGICVPGLVENGILKVASKRDNLVGLREDMISTPQYRAYLINDVRSAMYSQIPKYPHDSSICVVVIGTGIGLSVLLNGRFLHGAKGWIGEIGSCPVRKEDGSMSTFDGLIGGEAILKQSKLTIEELINRIDRGDAASVQIINDAAFHCGMCLSFIVNMYNPQYLVFTGSTTNFKGYREKAIEICKKFSISESFSACSFVNPEEGGQIVILGTIEFARMKFNKEDMP